MTGIDETVKALADCACVALADADHPVCTCSTTIGLPAIGRCCDCDGGQGELWTSLIRLYRLGAGPAYPVSLPQRACVPSEWAAEIRLVLARCFPVLTERGELPSPEDQAAAAARLHAEAALLERAIRCCKDTDPMYLRDIGVELDPDAGCSYLTLVVLAPVSLLSGDNPFPDA